MQTASDVIQEKTYQQGRADAIDECIEIIIKTCFVHFPCDDETIKFYLSVKQGILERMEQLKEETSNGCFRNNQ